MTLAESKWAQRRSNRTRTEQLVHDKDKAFRLLRRLYWKAETLCCSWKRAIDVLKCNDAGSKSAQNHSTILTYNAGKDSNTVQTMFKLDFFEFYVVLERYIVLCLEICGVRVPRGDPTDVKSSTPSASVSTFGSHRFHANLLSTLDQPDCPLYEALGQQDVRLCLGQAKEYRNRWKDADERVEDDTCDGHNEVSKSTLEELELPGMLRTILDGLDKARKIVELRQAADIGIVGGSNEKIEPNRVESHVRYELDDEEMEDAPWEAVEDAMEWE
ncbi:hypothetical protein AOQ84DRAFT_351463 [Glonium stellatum]|uniref:Uncharacterized protein n=1 Tax=Glonium stellatum TaxID=574774 RepID=A0A8E2FCA2_9PEZI|nr:hypothetical protein AOQ84DRAFT_351463 [Glonium stellatum]